MASGLNQNYFSRFGGFHANPQASLLVEFNRLAIDQAWSKKRSSKERVKCLIAELKLHGGVVGVGQAEKLANLQGLCRKLRVDPVPASITQCTLVCKHFDEMAEHF